MIWALCERFDVIENFDVVDCEGIDNLIKQIPVRIKQSGIESIGIIVDADTQLSSRWNSIYNVLHTIGYTLPIDFPVDGLLLKEPNMIPIGIWIMPDNLTNGMIEDFIKFLIPDNDSLLTMADGSLKQIEDEQLNKYKLIHKSKALIHTWLSWQEDPGTPIGASITKRYLTTDSKLCGTFINWLSKLFA